MRSLSFGVTVCVIISVFALSHPQTSVAQSDTCTRADFEAVVDSAGGALRRINSEKKPLFQAKLRALREKNRWGDAEFRQKAVPFVQDEKTAAYDDRIRQRLFDITNLGTSDETPTAQPDCALLDELRKALADLVTALEAKWAHLFSKIDKALAS